MKINPITLIIFWIVYIAFALFGAKLPKGIKLVELTVNQFIDLFILLCLMFFTYVWALWVTDEDKD